MTEMCKKLINLANKNKKGYPFSACIRYKGKKYFAGYYAIVEFNSKIYPIPCKAIVYINEIKVKENKNAKI